MHKSRKLPLGYIVRQRKEILSNNNYKRRGSRLYVTLTSGHIAQEKKRRHGVGDPNALSSLIGDQTAPKILALSVFSVS